MWGVKKTRDIYAKGSTEIVFDNYPVLGCCMEIEGEEHDVKDLASVFFPGKDVSFKPMTRTIKDYLENRRINGL